MNIFKITLLNIIFIFLLNFYFYCYNNDVNIIYHGNDDPHNHHNHHKNDDNNIIQPVLSRVGVNGGNITISQLNSFNISQLQINFQSLQYRKHTFQCTNQVQLSDNSIECSIPKGFGTYIVVVKDEKVHSIPFFWSYKLGQLSKNNFYNRKHLY
ncbi:hypothetical protein RB653_009169 [Dictyostelium firmibasis]|uniref:IPT/TIG domain-containing protein n=1 Tax=Dictyostelium firmibasis TaxID=79012 RepID=A0AAN7YUU9_9MYCE